MAAFVPFMLLLKISCMWQASNEAVSPRLRSTLIRVLNGSLERFRSSLIAMQTRRLAMLSKDTGVSKALLCAK